MSPRPRHHRRGLFDLAAEAGSDVIHINLPLVIANVMTVTVCKTPTGDPVCIGTKGNVMPSLRKTIIATRILLLAGASITTPAAAASFDGAWNVQIAST